MSEVSRIELNVDRAVAEIVLARADASNAIDRTWAEELATRCAEVDATSVRAVLIRADGPAFTVGGDLDHIGGHLDDLSDELHRMIDPFHRALQGLAGLPMPVVAAAHGAVAGGGLGLLWCADIVLLAEGTKLATGFSRLGLSGDGGSSWYLPRLVGLRRAIELHVQGRVLSAEEAVEWGLASRVVPLAALHDEARLVARNLGDGPTQTYAEMRRLLRGAFDRDLGAGLDAELQAIQACARTADAKEGIAAFLAHREPGFTGR
jgi:2-(1,2-epoxy-1,2-dihydrophenyl)acetyl-CoA isomerase